MEIISKKETYKEARELVKQLKENLKTFVVLSLQDIEQKNQNIYMMNYIEN